MWNAACTNWYIDIEISNGLRDHVIKLDNVKIAFSSDIELKIKRIVLLIM